MHPAETRKPLFDVTDLFVTAYDLIRKDVRSERSIHELVRALQLFKENRLEGVVLHEATGEVPVPTERRKAFAERVRQEGEDVLFREFQERLTTYARNRIPHQGIRSFRYLLIERRQVLADVWGLGPKTMDQVESALSEYGLYFQMSPQEIDHIFGSANGP